MESITKPKCSILLEGTNNDFLKLIVSLSLLNKYKTNLVAKEWSYPWRIMNKKSSRNGSTFKPSLHILWNYFGIKDL